MSSAALAVAVCAPAAAAPERSGAWMELSVEATVTGDTVSVAYSDHGEQRLWDDVGHTIASPTSMGVEIDFGDGSQPLRAHGMESACVTKYGLYPFSTARTTGAQRWDHGVGEMRWVPFQHRYAEPGRYDVTVTSYYCGDTEKSVSKKVSVVVPERAGQRTSPTSPVAGPIVQTDRVNESTSPLVAFGGVGLMAGAFAGAGAVRRRRA